jgi:hypothetical protein
MSTPENIPDTLSFRALVKTPISVMGLVSFCFFAVVLLVRIGMDVSGMQKNPGPYAGLVTYMILPAICASSIAFAAGGMVLAWRRYQTAGHRLEVLSWRRSWKSLLAAGVVTVAWLGLSLFGTYKAYQYSDSTVFCGLACHQVMEPEYTAYLNSDHARVNCVECHIGPGADWFVKAKVTGLRQVWGVATGSYRTPIKTPIDDLRPAQDTCEHCHWPGRFSGSVERVVTHYAPDDENTPTRFKLLLRVGGAEGGPAVSPGVHWHVSSRWKVEYLATDEKRQEIPYIRVTYADGHREEFAAAKFDRATLDESKLRPMDCLDCHNRPSHVFRSPNRALDQAMDLGRIDPRLPGIKRAALALFEKTYKTRAEAEAALAAGLDAYARDQKIPPDLAAVFATSREEILRVHRANFFPDHGVDYRAFVDNIGHFEHKGCERCHDGRHKTVDGKKAITTKCDNCHVLTGQATGVKEVAAMKYGQVEFAHPEDPVGPGKTCSSCHALDQDKEGGEGKGKDKEKEKGKE